MFQIEAHKCAEKSDNEKMEAFDISVIICAYSEERWDALVAAIESVQQQTLPPEEIIVVIDHCPGLMTRVRQQVRGVITAENMGVRGLSGARNSGIALTKSQIIAFLDDDAIAAPDWLTLLSEKFSDPQVLGVGGTVTPLWLDNFPAWFPEEFHWVVGCTYRGMSRSGQTIRNPVGASMALRREVFKVVGGFRSGIGRVGMRPAGCEETELCIRARQHWPRSVFLFQPQATVFHRVPGKRASWRYFCERCYAEGLSKAIVSRYAGAADSLASERTYILCTLPQGIVRGLSDAFVLRDLAGLARAGAIVLGLMITTAGYLVGSACLHLEKLKVKRKRGISKEEVFLQRSPSSIKTEP